MFFFLFQFHLYDIVDPQIGDVMEFNDNHTSLMDYFVGFFFISIEVYWCTSELSVFATGFV